MRATAIATAAALAPRAARRGAGTGAGAWAVRRPVGPAARRYRAVATTSGSGMTTSWATNATVVATASPPSAEPSAKAP